MQMQMRMWRLGILVALSAILVACEADDGGFGHDGGGWQWLDGGSRSDVPTVPDARDTGVNPDDIVAADDTNSPDLAAPADVSQDAPPRPDVGGECTTAADCTALYPDLSPCDRVGCDAGRCALGVGPAGGPCDDGNPCTTDDRCEADRCVGTPSFAPACLYAVSPDIGACEAGEVTEATKEAALAAVNRIRTLSGLPTVAYYPAGDDEAREAALMMVANADLSHEPPPAWHCWTQAGYDGANSSNLFIHFGSSPASQYPPEAPIIGLLVDNGVQSLGHRRWFLDPFLAAVSFGSVHGESLVAAPYPHAYAAVVKVIGTGQADLSGWGRDFVAYPYGDYPSELFDTNWYLSFSAVPDRNSKWGNADVDLGSARVTVTGPGGALSVSALSGNNDGYGLPNHLQWKVAGLQTDVTYTVAVSNLTYEGGPLDYEYTFTLR